jgi:hypothetical protein
MLRDPAHGDGVALASGHPELDLADVLGPPRRLAVVDHDGLREIDGRYSHLVERFNRQVDGDRSAALAPISSAIAAVSAQREVVAKIPTWPWRPDTLGSLLGTVALPVILYLLSRLLGRMLGI